MKLFNTRTLRNATFVVLLVWIFALASGVANACLLDDSSNSPVKQQSTFDLTDLGHAPFIVGAWPVVTTGASTLVREAVLRPSPPGPPIRVRFSRLIL